MRFIHSHLHEQFTIDEMAASLSISRRSLELKFRRALGCAPAARVRRTRIEAAKRLLTGTHDSMASVAGASGFHGARHLLAAFSHEVRLTPSAYRNTAKAAFPPPRKNSVTAGIF